MKELKEETSTQKLYWDSENEIVWSDLFGNQTEELAKKNIDAQERIRDSLNKEKTRVLIDMTAVTEISKEARDYFANERTASIQRATALLVSARKQDNRQLLHGTEQANLAHQIIHGSEQSDSVVTYVQ